MIFAVSPGGRVFRSRPRLLRRPRVKRCDCFKLQMRQAPLSAKEELTSRDCTESSIGQQMTSLEIVLVGGLAAL